MVKEQIFPNFSIDAKSDLVLGILAGRPYSARKCPMSDLIRALMRLSYSSAPDLEIELREILDRLIEDKYAKATNEGMYQITAKGVVFKEAGGYTGQKRKKQRKQFVKYLLLIGTWVAALATLGLLISELLKHYHKHLNHIWPSVAMVAPSQGFSNIPVCSIMYWYYVTIEGDDNIIVVIVIIIVFFEAAEPSLQQTKGKAGRKCRRVPLGVSEDYAIAA